jgi:hypothetical protein
MAYALPLNPFVRVACEMSVRQFREVLTRTGKYQEILKKQQ